MEVDGRAVRRFATQALRFIESGVAVTICGWVKAVAVLAV